MTRVGGGGADGNLAAFGGGEAARRRERDRGGDEELSSRGRPRDPGLAGQHMAFDQSGLDAGAERHAQFAETMRRALGERRDDAERPGEDEVRRVLAVAGAPAPLPSPFAPGAPLGAEASVLGPTTSERVETLANRIEAAVRAELRGEMGPAITLRLDIAGAMPGVDALTLTVSPTLIEVVLTRAAGADLPSDYAAAAQALADRLQSRFSKRLVRIVEAEAPGGTQTPSRGLEDISRLLAPPGEAS